MSGDAGFEVVQRVQELLQVDREWSQEVDRGFAWWAHRLRQAVWSSPPVESEGMSLYRVYAVTEVVRDVNLPRERLAPAPSVLKALAGFNYVADGSALIDDEEGAAVRAYSAVWAHEQNASWLGDVLATFAVVQLTEWEIRAEMAARALGGEPAVSAHPTRGARQQPDGMLEALSSTIAPEGGGPSPWRDVPEFEQLEQMLNRGNCVATSGGGAGLTAEFAFGAETSMLQVRADERHPMLGSGVGLFLQLPIRTTMEDATGYAWLLNRMEASEASGRLGHQLGAWTTKELGETGTYCPAFASFTPAILYRPGLLMNLALTVAAKAEEVGRRLRGAEEPCRVVDVVAARLKGSG